MSKIVQLKKEGINEYPITIPEAVIDNNGITVKDKIKNLEDTIKNIQPGGGSYDDTEIRQEIAELSERIDNLPTAEDEIFVVKYDTTTFQEVYDAYTSGKYVVLEYQNNVFHINRVEASDIYFISVNGITVYLIGLNSSNNWYQNAYQNEQSTNKVTTLSESSTNTQYPSAKAVYDFVSNTLGTIINGDY